MMELLEIQPRELKFTFELKKQSSCQVQLVNNSEQYVGFKVKTTSPKRYCVRPNTGVILPKSTCDFIVTMQAQRGAPPDMQCKDKFLIQSTVVPFGSTSEDITPNLFSKENGRYIEENKLKVVLVSPPHSPVLLPINGSLKQEPANEPSNLKDQLSNGVENLPPSHVVASKDFETAKDFEVAKDFEAAKDLTVKDFEVSKDFEAAKDLTGKDFEVAKDFAVAKDVEELKSKLKDLELKLNEAEKTITRLRDERSSTIQERDMLKQEQALAKMKSSVRKVQVGFPFLFVCFVAIISLALGYMLRA
ncbi:MSP domain-containing protein [Cinnamomum micranthum f. kanehirae]|uniref:MSP domain-containing protein n=1 Tax=Cinnamomum micranthum f. kanehirae TaxID=337451 RepID=A0A443PV97_9MAGN|nr:MSP domain-containing protein [Cinnamomum micranthum f. kanehirae]